MLRGGDMLLDLLPGVGAVKGFQQAFTGVNLVTGEKLSVGQRWMEGIGSAIGLIPIPGSKAIGKYGVEGAVALGKKAKGWFGKGNIPKVITECNCFSAGTKVLTDDGEKPIEDIQVGDKVLAKSDATGEVAYKEVVGLFQKQADEIYYVHIGDEIIEVTGEHPFWLDGRGWTYVKDLKVGDLLLSSDGTKLAIDKIEKESREAPFTILRLRTIIRTLYLTLGYGCIIVILILNCCLVLIHMVDFFKGKLLELKFIMPLIRHTVTSI